MLLRRPAVAALALVVSASVAALPGVAARAAGAGPALAIDVTAGRHAISPDIYGVNFADTSTAAAVAATTAMGVTIDRFGGNSASRFNYLNSETNTGSDYYFENVPSTPAKTFIDGDRSAGLRTLWTLPMTGYVAKRALTEHPYDCSFPRTTWATQDDFDYWDSNCGDGLTGGNPVGTADPATTSTAITPSFDAAEVTHLVSLYGTAAHGGVPIYQLDNEPSLWNSTHRDVHPAALTYDELASKTTSYAAAIKAADPSAAIDGPGDWGWCAYFYSAADGCNNGADKAAHGNVDFAPWYLAQLKAYQTAHGVRLLDYFDEHYYPQDSVSLTTAGSAALQAQRLQETRTLWDPTYLDDSWIGTDVGQQVDLIPRMHGWIDNNYPGTKLAISEYNFGGLESLNGALTEADILGIFGRERVDLATLWDGPTATQPGAFAFRLFRNYDGAGATFGDTYVSSTSADQGKLSVYGAQRSSDGAVTAVVINKTGGDLTSSVALSDFAAAGTAQVWRYSGANLSQIVRQPDIAASSSMSLIFPASSATMLVIPAAAAVVTPPTTAPPTTAPPTPAPTTAPPSPTSPPAAGSAPVVTAPSALTSAVAVSYGQPIPSLAASAVSVTEQPSGLAVAVRLTCLDGHQAVSCATGPVTTAAVAPVGSWLAGDRYQLSVTGAGAVQSAFRATTLLTATNPAVAYQWATVKTPRAYGGSLLVAGTADATASYRFTGPAITWWSSTGQAQGIADVYVDGKRRAVINGYAGTTSLRVAHSLGHLGSGPHVLTVKVRGSKGSRHATDSQVTIDAVRVGAGKVLVNPAVTMSWSAGTPGASASVAFVGTGISWTTVAKPSQLAVYVDGKRLSARTHAVTGLAPGRHRLRLVILRGTVRVSGYRIT